jgi:hypothetical protein
LITYYVNFLVSDANGIISGAEVDFNSERKFTLDEGTVEFLQVIPASGLSYSVTKSPTHNPVEGTVDITSDTTIRVMLTMIDVPDELFKGLSLYPNPLTDDFTIEIPGAISGFDFEISDQTGRKVLSGKSASALKRIEMQQVSKGVYFIKLIVNHKSITRKLILQ